MLTCTHDCNVFYIIDPPSPPFNLSSLVSYGVSEYSVRVQWQTPSDDGGVGVDNYVLSVSGDNYLLNLNLTNTVMYSLQLNYSTNYSIIVTARNCAGFSDSTSLNVLEGKCILIPDQLYTSACTCTHTHLTLSLVSQLAVVDHLLQSMVVLRSTGVQRRGQRSSSTVMRATLLMSGTYHNVRTQCGLQTHNFSIVLLLTFQVI